MPGGTWSPGQLATQGKVFNSNIVVNGWVLAQKGFATYPPTVTTPGTVASGGTVVNTTGFDCNVYAATAAGGTITAVTIGGVAIPGTIAATTTADWYLPLGSSIIVTYSGTLAWKWLAV